MIRPRILKSFHAANEKIQDFYYNQSASAPGFLKLVLAIRFIVLVIMTINFGLMLESEQTGTSSPPGLNPWVLWLYFIFILGLLSLAVFQPDRFESRKVQVLQVVMDGVVITYFYLASGDPGSYIFLLYFLPLLVIARFFELRSVILFLLSVALASSLIWIRILPSEKISSVRFWFQNLLPQYGFLLILTIFYLIYYRRRTMGGRHQATELELEKQLDHLWQGWFSVDRDLKVSGMDAAMSRRHGLTESGTTCAEALCRRGLTTREPCTDCPLTQAMESGKAVEKEDMLVTDRHGAQYPARLVAQPILDYRQQVIGASVWVQDLKERRSFEQRLRGLTEDLERVIDQNRQEDRARLKKLAQQMEAISHASESALSIDLLSGADEIVQVLASMLGCRLAVVRQLQVDKKTGREGLALTNSFGLDPLDASRISFLDLDSNSLTVQAFLTGKDEYIEDLQVTHQMHFEDIWRKYGLRSMACFPLIVQGRSIGTFSLFRNRPQGFSQEDLRLGRALANNLTSLVASQQQHAHDRQEAERRKHELDVLSALSRKLVPVENPQMLAQMVADIVRQELSAETAAVFIKEDDSLYRASISGVENDWFSEESYPVGCGITGQAALPDPGDYYGKTMLENDVEHSTTVVPDNLVRYSQRLATGTVSHLLAVPLNGQEGTFGVLRVVNKLTPEGKLDPHGFTEPEAGLMMTLACIVAVAIENTRLFELEKKKRLLEQALRQSTRKLSSTLEEEQILDTILEQLKQVVSYNSASLFLQEQDGLRLKAMAGFRAEEERQLREVRLDPATNLPFQHMCTTHQPVLVNDLWQEPILEPIIGTKRIRSWIGAPLIFQDQVLGWLSVDNWEPDQYTQEDAEIALAFAQQAAIAINNARQFKAQSELADFLMKLDQSLVKISSATEKRETMNCVAQAASELMACDIAGVALYDKEKKEIYALPDAGYVGVYEEYASNFRFPVDHSGGRVLREKKVFHSYDAINDPNSIFGKRLIWPAGVRGLIAAPLTVGEHIVGILYAASHLPRVCTEAQQTFFSILSNHAAIAIRNAELLDVRERRAQLLNLLHNLSMAGQLTNDPEVIYNILLTAVTAEYGLRFNRALLLLYNKERNALMGFTGIGQVDYSEAYHTWETLDEHSRTFEGYIREVLEHGIIRYTTLHYKAKNLEIPINAESNEVFSRAFRTGKTLQVNSADDQETINTEFYRLFEPNHFVLAPLMVNNDVVGMLVVDNKFTGEPIRPMELELLESCASQAAAAIYRSNLHHQVEDRVHVMEHLQELAQAFSVLAEPREVLRRIVKATTELLRADITYLVPFDPDMKELLVEEAVTAGAETSFQHEGTFSSSGLTALAMNEPGGLVVIEDLEAREDLRSRFADQERIRSVAACRLELSKHIVGMLYINYQRNHRYSELELNTLRMLAGQAAVAIYNARLLMQIEKLATQRERSRLREDLHGVLNTFAFKVMEPAESIFEKEKSKRRKDQKLVEEADELWRFSRHTYKQLELILEDMRDPVLVERGLPEALRLLVTSSKLPGVRLSIAGETRPSAEVELALYRICQEAVSNIRKHACLPEQGENLVKIQLELGDEQSCLLIQDQGRGFSSQIINDRRKGMGLQAMTNWARNVGAQIDIQSIPGKGTRIVVVVPKTKNKESV